MENDIYHQFGIRLCQYLNPIYSENKKSFHPLKPVEDGTVFYYPFAYTDINTLPTISAKLNDSELNEILQSQQAGLIYQYEICFYKSDRIYFIKPKNHLYWVQSRVRHNACFIVQQLVEAGY